MFPETKSKGTSRFWGKQNYPLCTVQDCNIASNLNCMKKNLVVDSKTCLFSMKRENFGSYDHDNSSCNCLQLKSHIFVVCG